MLRTTSAFALHEDGHRLILRTPKLHYYVRAGTLGVLVPVLLVVLVGLFALLELLQVGEVGGLTLIVAVVGALMSAIAIPFAVGMAVMAPRLSRQSEVVIDQAARVIHPREGEPVPLDRVVGLSLRKPNAMLKWMNIEADVAESASSDPSPYRAPAKRAVVLVSRINELEAEAGRKLMADIGRRLDLHTADRTSSLMGGGGATGKAAGRGAHALAYLPVQGIFLFASLFLLVARKGDPRAAFHAKQSLLAFAFELVLIVAGVVVAVPFILLEDALDVGLPIPIGALVMLGTLLPFVAVRLVGRFYAAWRAWKGETWLIPVVGRISRRWLPEAS